MSVTTLVRRALRGAQRLLPAADEGTLVLAYHLVGGGTSSPVDLPLRTFRRQVDEIRRLCRPLPLDRTLDPTTDHRPRIVVTFDDAHENFHRVAWPVLRDAGVPATLYVPTGFVDGEIASPIRQGKGLAAMTWDALGELANEELITLGSHGRRHVNLARTKAGEIDDELESSRERMESELGIAVEDYCYPEGGWTREAEARVARVYRTAVIAGGRRAHPGRTRPTAIPRVPIRRDMPESLEPLFRAPVWLEERLAAGVRSLRWRRDRWRGDDGIRR